MERATLVGRARRSVCPSRRSPFWKSGQIQRRPHEPLKRLPQSSRSPTAGAQTGTASRDGPPSSWLTLALQHGTAIERKRPIVPGAPARRFCTTLPPVWSGPQAVPPISVLRECNYRNISVAAEPAMVIRLTSGNSGQSTLEWRARSASRDGLVQAIEQAEQYGRRAAAALAPTIENLAMLRRQLEMGCSVESILEFMVVTGGAEKRRAADEAIHCYDARGHRTARAHDAGAGGRVGISSRRGRANDEAVPPKRSPSSPRWTNPYCRSSRCGMRNAQGNPGLRTDARIW